jgi:DNA replication protein DnaC
MTAFLKIDRCKACGREISWEWVPPILLIGKPLAGTGVWRSRLINDVCPACTEAREAENARRQQARANQERLVQLFGGEKPYREFTFERYRVTPGNELAFRSAKQFDPLTDNLYVWGPPGVGKTHLAYAIARTNFDQRDSVSVVKTWQVTRKLRMKTPDEEQHGIDEFARVGVLVLEDFGIGTDTVYGRQIFQEILDKRDFRGRGGLVVTSRCSLRVLRTRLNDDAIPSRLTGMCRVVEIRGADQRLLQQSIACKNPIATPS